MSTAATSSAELEKDFRLFPEAVSTMAGEIDAIYLALLGLNSVIVLIVVAMVVTFAVRYRQGSNADRTERMPLRRQHWLEWSWVAVIAGIFLAVFAWSGAVYFRLYTVPENALPIHVIGKQWMWKFQHPGGQREINELHVPVNRQIKLTLASQDVVHSFYVPAFRLKRDVVPGSYRELWFEATRPGVYHMFCAEYCGSRHSRMGGRVVVMEPAAYARWLRQQNVSGSLAAQGGDLFRSFGCSGCHSPGSRVRAPSLAGIFGRPQPLESGGTVIADEAYLRDSILRPNRHVVAGFTPIMPSFAGQIDEGDLLKIIEFIKNLDPGQEIRE